MSSAGPVRPPPVLVIGLGNPRRRDDAVGLLLARTLAKGFADDPRVEVRCHPGDPLDLIELGRDRHAVLLLDAARSGAPAGTLHRIDDPDALPPWLGAVSSHAVGPSDALALARVLGVLPRRVVVIAVEAGDTGHGRKLGPELRRVWQTLVRSATAAARDLADGPAADAGADAESGAAGAAGVTPAAG